MSEVGSAREQSEDPLPATATGPWSPSPEAVAKAAEGSAIYTRVEERAMRLFSLGLGLEQNPVISVDSSSADDHDGPITRETLPKIFVGIADSVPSEHFGSVTYGVCQATFKVACGHPASLDDLLAIYQETAAISDPKRSASSWSTFGAHLVMEMTETMHHGYRPSSS